MQNGNKSFATWIAVAIAAAVAALSAAAPVIRIGANQVSIEKRVDGHDEIIEAIRSDIGEIKTSMAAIAAKVE